jgi:protein-tyrosine phosphatase
MLMALLRAEAERQGLDVTVESAGTAAIDGDEASTYARTCMNLRGLDIDDHRSRRIDDLDLNSYDWLLCMTSSHAAALRTRGVPAGRLAVVNAEHGGVPDPFGGDLDEYSRCAGVLEGYARTVVQTLMKPGR